MTPPAHRSVGLAGARSSSVRGGRRARVSPPHSAWGPFSQCLIIASPRWGRSPRAADVGWGAAGRGNGPSANGPPGEPDLQIAAAIDHLVSLAEVMAADLLRPYGLLAIVLATALKIRRTLTGTEADEIIGNTLAGFAQAEELSRPADWHKRDVTQPLSDGIRPSGRRRAALCCSRSDGLIP